MVGLDQTVMQGLGYQFFDVYNINYTVAAYFTASVHSGRWRSSRSRLAAYTDFATPGRTTRATTWRTFQKFSSNENGLILTSAIIYMIDLQSKIVTTASRSYIPL